MKPTTQELSKAIHAMGCIIPFFPQNEETQILLAQLIGQFVNSKEELDWLTLTACGHIRDWERGGGIVELRGIFCSRFAPADKIAAGCSTPGFRIEDLENRFIAREMQENERRLEEYKTERLGGPAEDQKAFPLPKPKLIQ